MQHTTTRAYDNNGNTLTKVIGSNTTSYAWDYENRMTSVTLPGSGGTVTFKYDPFGRRIYKSSSSSTSVYAYDGDNMVEETNGTGTVVARYEQTQNIDEPLAMLRSGATSYYHADGLGSVTSLSSSAGAIANTYTYDSFGKLTASTGSLVNPFRYTARESDTETGLYYYRARYYDQSVGRFLSEDPINFRAGINFYRYVYNYPTRFRDPKGKDPVIGAGIGIVLGGIYGGLGAAAQGGDWGDILTGAAGGAVVGGLMGTLDPSLEVGTLALWGGMLGGFADTAGQAITAMRHGDYRCRQFNFGSLAGSVLGGALGGAVTPVAATIVGDAGASVLAREAFPAGISGFFGLGGTLAGGLAGEPKKPCGCQ